MVKCAPSGIAFENCEIERNPEETVADGKRKNPKKEKTWRRACATHILLENKGEYGLIAFVIVRLYRVA